MIEEYDESKKGLSIASLVLGIVGLLSSCYGGFVLGILAIIFGGICIYKKEGIKGMAITGLVLGIISIAYFVILFLILGASFAALAAFLPH